MLGWELPPYHSGGLGIACYQLCKGLAKAGVGIEFIVPYEAEHNIDFMKVTSATKVAVEEFALALGAYTTERSAQISLMPMSFQNLFEQTQNYARSIDHVVKMAEFDVIHAHDWLTVSAALRAKAISGKPLIMHYHATEFDRTAGSRGNEMVHEIEQMGLSMADLVITVSEYTRQLVINNYGVDPDRVRVVHNRIDADMYDLADRKNSYPAFEQLKKSGFKVVSHIGRITIQKGLWNLLHAFEQVVDKRPKTLLLMAGNGEQIRELQVLAADLGIAQNVFFTNKFVGGTDWSSAFKQTDLFLLPSVSEPFGLTPLEAALFGVPSLATRQCGVTEIFKNCLKVDYWDEKEMANQIVSALNSDSLLEVLTANAMLEVKQLTWHAASEHFIDSYEAVLA